MKTLFKTYLDFFIPALVKKISFRKLHSTTLTDLKKAKIIEPELLYINKIVESDKVVIDIGANMGEYLYAFEKANKFTRIIGIEPNYQLANRLQKLFSSCQVFNTAISNVNENKKLKIPVVNGKYLESRATFEDFTEIGETDKLYIDVPCLTLDCFVTENSIHNIGLLKIDVEGHEMNVIEGAAQVLSQERPIILVEVEQRHHQQPIADILQRIASYGYRGYIFNMVEMCFLEIKDFSVTQYQKINELKTEKYLNNFLFLPHESHFYLDSLNSVIKSMHT